jgi:tRNA threonylcarbamoyl adenosine modification protein YeaZ/ribosomal-protein-alanine acetyltransferase
VNSPPWPDGPGLGIEAATGRVEVAVFGPDGVGRRHVAEDVRHGHTRRLVPMIAGALEGAGLAPRELAWVAVDLGPGSFTGVRVGLATAEALAQASGARLLGASSLAALAHGAGAKRALVVPLVPAGRRDVYAGFFRADARGTAWMLAAPQVGTTDAILAATAEAHALLGAAAVYFVGPGAARERETLERVLPGSTEPPFRHEGLSALDLALAARSGRGPLAGLPDPGAPLKPVYVRPPQAEEHVRRRLSPSQLSLRPFHVHDIPVVMEIERHVFSDPWPESFFREELGSPMVFAQIAERNGALAGYLVAWMGEGEGHLGNLAVVAEHRRHGVAAALLTAMFEEADARNVSHIALEVRVTNAAAQALYRAHGFRLAGLRQRYYRDRNEDALIMTWQRDPRATRGGAAHSERRTAGRTTPRG